MRTWRRGCAATARATARTPRRRTWPWATRAASCGTARCVPVRGGARPLAPWQRAEAAHEPRALEPAPPPRPSSLRPLQACARARRVPEPAAPGPRRAAAAARPRPARRALARAGAERAARGRAVRAREVHDAAGAPPRVQRAAGHAGDAGRAAAGRRPHAAGRPAGPRPGCPSGALGGAGEVLAGRRAEPAAPCCGGAGSPRSRLCRLGCLVGASCACRSSDSGWASWEGACEDMSERAEWGLKLGGNVLWRAS